MMLRLTVPGVIGRQCRICANAQTVREASARGDRTLGVEHVLLGLLRDSQGCAAGVLGALGIVPIDVEEAVEAALARQRLAAD